MHFSVHLPSPELREFVRCFWTLESTAGEEVPAMYQAMGDACAELIFQCRGGFVEFGYERAILIAPRSQSRRRPLHRTIGMFGVRIFPWGIEPLFGVPSNELTDTVVDFRELFGVDAEVLARRVVNARTVAEQIQCVEQFLRSALHLRSLSTIAPIVREVLSATGRTSLSSLVHDSGLSQRQMERRFTTCTGFPPKYYARIVRFQAVKQSYLRNCNETLGHVAQDSGYCDQSHFIREFKEFSGMTPGAYFAMVANTDSSESKIIRGLIAVKEHMGDE